MRIETLDMKENTMLNVFKYIFVMGNLLGFIMVGIALWRFNI